MVGARGHDTVVAAWHFTGQEGALVIAGMPAGVRVLDVFGQPITAAQPGTGAMKIPLGPRRTTLLLPNTSVPTASALLKSARLNRANRSAVCQRVRG